MNNTLSTSKTEEVLEELTRALCAIRTVAIDELGFDLIRRSSVLDIAKQRLVQQRAMADQVEG